MSEFYAIYCKDDESFFEVVKASSYSEAIDRMSDERGLVDDLFGYGGIECYGIRLRVSDDRFDSRDYDSFRSRGFLYSNQLSFDFRRV